MNLKPHTYKQWEHYAGPVSGCCSRPRERGSKPSGEEGSLLGSVPRGDVEAVLSRKEGSRTVSDEPKEEQTAELLQSIGDELREIKSIQQVMARNFNAVVVMIVFAVIMYVLGMFLGPTIGRRMDELLTGTKAGRALEGAAKSINQ